MSIVSIIPTEYPIIEELLSIIYPWVAPGLHPKEGKVEKRFGDGFVNPP